MYVGGHGSLPAVGAEPKRWESRAGGGVCVGGRRLRPSGARRAGWEEEGQEKTEIQLLCAGDFGSGKRESAIGMGGIVTGWMGEAEGVCKRVSQRGGGWGCICVRVGDGWMRAQRAQELGFVDDLAARERSVVDASEDGNVHAGQGIELTMPWQSGQACDSYGGNGR